MEAIIHNLKLSWFSIKRAPLPYALTLLILSLGLGTFFSNATLYYWMNRDPIPEKSQTLFMARINSLPGDCTDCLEPSRVMSYMDMQKMSGSGITSAEAAMFSSDAYAKTLENQQATPAKVALRITQRDFFALFNVPFLYGEAWPDNKARMEVVISKNTAVKFFGRIDVVGQDMLLDDQLFKVIGVLDDWSMLPRLYDVNGRRSAEPTEDIYMPLETAYDLAIQSNTQNSFTDVDWDGNIATYPHMARTNFANMLQFWVQLDGPEKIQQYQQFLKNMVADEKAAGRHPRPEGNRLDNILDVQKAMRATNDQLDAFALVASLFLLVCVVNASHLSLNRYMANQYEFSLRRALGASRWQLQGQILADVFVSSALAFVAALLFARLGLWTINALLPGTRALASWDWQMLAVMAVFVSLVSYLVTLYPALKTSFSPLNQQLKQ
ncbi:FtsX-like permease family protein [Rheinheimera sediminis]|uniref:ABC transporter permease n=1 Tax=Rheinheimera sp. YQF-1 TaxID=2499626 RepID=UPI000FDBD696|nr:ABC transporter permease [Rheinheimera sp. YQF-1]RVT44220.1 FtsX-like permease family protein [Rheinheimera sp. YQF-1]